MGGVHKIECCPLSNVDGELDYICKMAKVRTLVVRSIFLVFTSDPLWGSPSMDQVAAKSFRDSELDSSDTRSVPSVRSKGFIYLFVAALAWGITPFSR